MLLCQLGRAHSLREICGGLRSSEGKLKHLGIEAPARPTLAYANEHRPWELYRAVFQALLGRCQAQVAGRRKFRFKNKLVSLDSTVIVNRTRSGAISMRLLLLGRAVMGKALGRPGKARGQGADGASLGGTGLALKRGVEDPLDVVQVKYELLRRVRVERAPVTHAVAAFGVSRPTYYQAQAAFVQGGLGGLVPRKRGRRSAHKLTPAVMAYVAAARADERASTKTLVQQIEDRFGVSVHPRSLEPGAGPRGKKRP
jgi:hypothetical protein